MILRSGIPAVITVVGGLAATGVAAQAPVTTQAPVTAFVNVSVIPMDREQVITDQTVLVQGDRITALGPANQVAVPATAVRVDGQGKFLMPGLADMHFHFATIDGSWILNTEVDVAKLLLALVANGVTTVRDMHSGSPWNGNPDAAWMPKLRQQIATGELLGPRIYAAGDPDNASPAAAAKSVVALKALGYDFVKYYSNQRPLYDSILAAGRRVGLPIVSHGLYTYNGQGGMPLVFQDRWASIEHLYGYLEYALGISEWWGRSTDSARVQRAVDDTTVRRIALETKQAGAWNCPTLAAVRQILQDAGLTETAASNVAFYPRLVRALQDAGAGLLLGSDVNFMDEALSWDKFSIHDELQALVDAGLTPYEALATGTRNVAQFLGTEDSTGTVAVGKRADLILLQANPLKSIGHATELAGVMVGGRWLSRAELDERRSKMR